MPGAPEVVQRKITRLDFKEYCEKIAQRIHWQLPPASYPRKGIYSEGSKYEEPDKGRQSQSQYAGVLEEKYSGDDNEKSSECDACADGRWED